MAFKGSQNLAPGEFVAFLQRAGLAFGADTNARTGFDQTVYQLDLPRDDAALVDESIGILSEIAGRLTLAAGPDRARARRDLEREAPARHAGRSLVRGDARLPAARLALRRSASRSASRA